MNVTDKIIIIVLLGQYGGHGTQGLNGKCLIDNFFLQAYG